MAILVIGFYLAYIAVVRGNRYNPINLSNSGRYVFITLAIMECIMIMLIAPVFSCGTFTGEREQGTMDLLRTTLLKPGRIIAGPLVEHCRRFPNQEEVTVQGLHFVQEDAPRQIGEAIAAFVSRIGT